MTESVVNRYQNGVRPGISYFPWLEHVP
jgi:hypothetical protein